MNIRQHQIRYFDTKVSNYSTCVMTILIEKLVFYSDTAGNRNRDFTRPQTG